MNLTSKQKRALKSLGMKMGDDLRVGSAGLSEGFIQHLDELLSRQELVKLRFTEAATADRREFARQVCKASSAECVSVVGRTMLLYRANPQLDPAKRALNDE